MALKFIGTEEYKIPTNIPEYERLGAATKYKFGDERGSTFDVALQPGTFATTKSGEYFEVLQGGALKPIAEQEALSGRLLAGTQIPEFAKQYLQYAPGATVSPTRGDTAQKEILEATRGTTPTGGVITSAGTRGATAEEALTKEAGTVKTQGEITPASSVGILAMTAMTKPIITPKLPEIKTSLTPTEFELLRKAKGVSEANFDQYFSRDASGNIYYKGADKRLYENRGLTANQDAIQALAKFYMGRPATAEELKLAGGNLGSAEDIFAQKRNEIGTSGLTGLIGGVDKITESGKVEMAAPVIDMIAKETATKTQSTVQNISQNISTEIPKQIAILQNRLQTQAQAQLEVEKGTQAGLVMDLKTLAFASTTDKIKNVLEQYKISQNIQALTDIQNKVNTIQASLNLGILEQEGRAVSMGIISRRQDALNRQAAAQIGALNASAQVIQGNIDQAYRSAGLVIDAMAEDRQSQISAYNYLLGLSEKNIVKLETEVKDAIKEQIELGNKETERMQKNKDSLLKLIIDNPIAAVDAGIGLMDDYDAAVTKMLPYISAESEAKTKLENKTKEAQLNNLMENKKVIGSEDIGYYEYDYNTKKWEQIISPKIGGEKILTPTELAALGIPSTYYGITQSGAQTLIKNGLVEQSLTPAQQSIFNGIVNKYNASPLIAASDRTIVLDNTIKQIKQNPGNGALQLNLVYSYIQALDSYQSAVREGELALSGNIQSLIEKLKTNVERVQTGKIIGNDSALEIANAGQLLVDTIKQGAKQKATSFKAQAQASHPAIGQAWDNYIAGFTAGYEKIISKKVLPKITETPISLQSLLAKYPDYGDKIIELSNKYPRASDDEILDIIIQSQNFNSVGGDTDEAEKISEAIGQFESGGNYKAVGQETGKGKAYGKYQIMDFNIPSWSKEALGYSITPQEFLNSPDLQDKIAKYKIARYYRQYGNLEDVSSVWFSGRPLAQAGKSKDVLGTSVPQYVKNIQENYKKLA